MKGKLEQQPCVESLPSMNMVEPVRSPGGWQLSGGSLKDPVFEM